MFKITSQFDKAVQGVFLIIEGRLAGPWVEELRAYCQCMCDEQQPCRRLDLTGVTFIDGDGKLLLTQLWQQGVELRAAGCLTRCLVEEITNAGRNESAGLHDNRRTS